MNSTYFKKLSLSHQSSFLWEEGVHLCTKKNALYLVHLYAIRNFYVEVHFPHNLCRIEHINVFDDTSGLEPYILDLPMPANFA